MSLYFTKWIFLVCLTTVLVSWSFVSAAQQDTLWGTTSSGGGQGNGDLFSMNMDGTNLQVAYSFAASDGSPVGSLIRYKGLLYGFAAGGVNAAGEIFSYNPATATFADVYDFNFTTGGTPTGKLVLYPASGLLYGVTQNGGANSQGVIFSFDPVAGVYTDVYDMVNNGVTNTGASPSGPLTLYNNVLYGMAGSGANSGGVIFSFDPATNTYTDLYDAADIQATQNDPSFVVSGNLLYGIGSNGGQYGQGVLFSFDPASRNYTPLANFNDTLGAYPIGIVSAGGSIYGVTKGGGGVDINGELFTFDAVARKLKVVYSFSSTTGVSPAGNIITSGTNLLGMVSSGGAGGVGVAYSYNLAGNTYSDIRDFDFSATGSSTNPCQLLRVHIIGASPQTIAFGNVKKTYGDAPFDPGATASSGLPVVYSSDNPLVASVIGNHVRVTGAGTANITVNQEGNPTYDSVSLTQTLTVAPAPLLIRAVDTFRNQALPNPVFRALYTGFVNGESPASLSVLPVLSTTAVLSSLQGAYPITVSGAMDPNYAISYQSGTLTVIGLLQHITVSDSTAVYGGPDLAPATASSGLPVTYTSSNPAIVSITADQKVHILTAGTTILIINQAGDANYASTSDTVSFRVIPALLSIVADNKTKVYSQPDPLFTATYAGFINGDNAGSLTARPVFTSTAGPGASPGTYLINVGGAADSNYTISYTAGTYLLTPVEGSQLSSLDTWFSSNTSLQVNVWLPADRMAAQQDIFIIQVYDAGGRPLINKETSLARGYNAFTLPAGGLASGIYIIRVAGNNLKLSKTIRKIN